MTYEVLSRCEASRELELVGHVACAHDLVGPLSIDVVLLVNFEPSSTDTSCSGSIVDGKEEVGNGAGMTRLIPLDLDAVSSSGLNGLHSTLAGRRDVASHVVARDIGHRAVGRRHPNSDLVPRSLVVDP